LTIAERLARYAHSLRDQALPSTVIHEVKRRVLDSVACALGGWSAEPCRIARRVAEEVRVRNGATLWGTRLKTTPDLAAFANGALVRYLDFNDTYLAREPAHPSDNIPAVFAVGEVARASGRRVIQALAIAYELQCRLCDAAALRPRGWDHVTYGPFSSAVGAAVAWRLSQRAIEQAINLAGVANVALRQTRVGDLSMWKACAFSNAARNGIFAARLAQLGLTGPSPIFEGEKGFMKLVSGPLDLPELGGERTASQEETPFKILDTYIKYFPVEYHAQTAVEAALRVRQELLKDEGPEPVRALKAIREIEIGSYDVAIEIIGRDPEKWRPKTRETADHSFPYCVAVALKTGAVTTQSFSARHLTDPDLLDLMRKIRVTDCEEFHGCYPQSMPTRLTVRTAAGKEYASHVDYPHGHPKHPMSDHEVEAKFRKLTMGKLERSRAQRVIEMIWNLDTLKDVGTLMPLLEVTKR
jgi:2-methylcitrate dehydratase